MHDIAPFFHSWLRKRREVASVIPSFRWLVNAVCHTIARQTRQVVVELGPGTGPITRGLLRDGVLSPDSKLILVESNDMLVAYLREHVHDPRVTIVHDTAENIHAILQSAGEEKADAIVSGIPYSYFTEELREKIVQASADALKQDGTHVIYQVRTAVEPVLRQYFKNVRKSRVWRNIPPLYLFEAREPNVSAPRM